MDAKEMIALEEKTRMIVDTLSSLEDELTLQRQANKDLAAERNRLMGVSASLEEAAKGIHNATDLLAKSTLSQEIDAIRKGLADLSQACKVFDERIDALASLEDKLRDRVVAFESLRTDVESIIDSKMAEGIAPLKAISESLDAKMEELASLDRQMITKIEALADFDQRMNERIDAFEHMKDEIIRSLDAKTTEVTSGNEAISATLAEMDLVVGRIDRNTQKGFGKERG